MKTDKKIERKQKVFQGTPDQLEKLLEDGWYIEQILHSEILGEVYYRTENMESKQNVVILVVHLSKENYENR